MSPVETQTRPASGGGGRGRAGTRVAAGDLPPEPRRGSSLLRALARALPWALGAAIGVAAGAYLTAVSGAGAPGTGGIEPAVDLVALPALAFVVVLVVHLLLQAGGVVLRRARRR